MSSSWAYYNELDPQKAAWLRELIKSGAIAPGDVDERSIKDVTATDLVEYTQHHFFAGIGVWSYALRRAGWSDDRPVWTASCPCPPFSVAGKKKACPECGGGKPLPHAFRTGVFRCTACGHDWYADGRHLWPELYRLVKEFGPVMVFGEQVAGSDGLAWGDIVQATLELEKYTVGRVPFAACGVGAPHIRQRLYWMAHAALRRQPGGLREGYAGHGDGATGRQEQAGSASPAGGPCRVDDAFSHGRPPRRHHNREHDRKQPCADLSAGRLEQPGGVGRERRETPAPGHYNGGAAPQRQESEYGPGVAGPHRIPEDLPGPVNGHWRDADWLFCRDGKWRPVKSGTFPLAHGAPARVGRLRGYGDAINAEAATAFIKAAMEIIDTEETQ